MKTKLVALAGKAGTGKDTILNRVCESEFGLEHLHKIVPVTTRPKREKESETAYHFITTDEYTKLLLEDKLMTFYTSENYWFYGTRYEDYDPNKINIGIFTTYELDSLNLSSTDLLVIYIDAEDKVRLVRQLFREDNPNIEEIFRRYHSDKNDYDPDDILKYYHGFLVTNNDNNSLIPCVETICRVISDNYN